jgi:ABC-type uncharacterized transport system ATPase subunit
MVHQHFMLVPVFTVTENVMLGAETTEYGIFLQKKQVRDEIKSISDSYKLIVDPDAYIENLSVGVQQRVEIIKILYRKAEILIFDEPTAVLTPQEVEEFFIIVKQLIKQGKSIIFITHKLGEVLEIADRIAVLRNGKLVGYADPKTTSEAILANMMVGREVFLQVDKEEKKAGPVILDVRNLTVKDDRNLTAVNEVSFQVKQGEIFSIAGVQGNGQRELVEALFGLRKKENGEVYFSNHDISASTPREIHNLEIGYIPEDRQKDGLVLSFPVYDNLILNNYYDRPYSKGLVLQEEVILKTSGKKVEDFDIRPRKIDLLASSLSGGNQQKVIVARELSREIRLLIASQPTRGLDVGSIEYIHGQLVKKRDNDCAILLISTELDEILSLSDRIAVMYKGQIVDVLDAKKATREKLGLLMAGIKNTK